MTNDITVPDWAKNGMDSAFADLDPNDDAMSAGVGQGYPVIGYRNGKWSLRYRGNKHMFGTPMLNVVILGCPRVISKTYYKAGGVAAEGERPICSSMNGAVPDDDVLQKQHDNCPLCPRNAWKTQENGKRGRECKDGKRLAVLIMPEFTKRLLGEPLMEPVLLRVPPDSLRSLADLQEEMGNRLKMHHASYITQLTFDPNKEHVSILFNGKFDGGGKITGDSARAIREMMDSPTVERIMHGKTMRTVEPQLPSVSIFSPSPGTIITNGSAADPKAVHTGGYISGSTVVAPKAAPVTIEDVGKLEEADLSMDARIKAFLAAQ